MIKKFSKAMPGMRPEHFFLVTASVFGVLFAALIPPFHNPDEPVHYFRVYQLSTLSIFAENTKKGIATTIPSSYIRSIQDNLSNGDQQINFHPETKASPTKILQTITYPLNENKKEKTLYSTAASYSPTSYIPQVIIMWIDRLIGLSPVATLYTLRFAGLALYIGVIYTALKILPVRKWAIALIAVLPMSLAQAAAVTADSALIAFLILFMAIILYLMREKKHKITNSMKLLLGASLVILGMSKQIFILATPLILLIPSRAFISKRARWKYIAGILVITWLLAGIWTATNPAFQTSLANSAAATDAHARISATIQYPQRLVVVAFNTFLTPQSNELYITLAGSFGWLDTPIPLWIACIVLGILVFCLIADYDSKLIKPPRYYNLSVVGVVVMLFLATCAVFYVYWTPVESRKILGLQGRYFMPLLIFLALLHGKKLISTTEQQYSRLILLAAPFILSISIITIIGRFYWKV